VTPARDLVTHQVAYTWGLDGYAAQAMVADVEKWMELSPFHPEVSAAAHLVATELLAVLKPKAEAAMRAAEMMARALAPQIAQLQDAERLAYPYPVVLR
jgi:uncharacterized protein YciW